MVVRNYKVYQTQDFIPKMYLKDDAQKDLLKSLAAHLLCNFFLQELVCTENEHPSLSTQPVLSWLPWQPIDFEAQ